MNGLLTVHNILDPTIYYIFHHHPSENSHYWKLTGQELHFDYIESLRRHPKWAIMEISGRTDLYDKIIIQLYDLPEFYDILTEISIKHAQCLLSSYDPLEDDIKIAYFNAGLLLARNPKRIDNAIQYLLKADDLPQAKKFRRELFAFAYRLGLSPESIPDISLDYQTILAFALMWRDK